MVTRSLGGVVAAVEARRDHQWLERPERELDVGVAHALDKFQPHDQQRELQRRNADGEAYGEIPQEGDDLVEQMVAVIGPEAELTLRVMQRMQRVPPPIGVGEPMAPIFGEIQDQRIAKERDDRMAEQKGKTISRSGGMKPASTTAPLKKVCSW